jgi:hypothetical protein
MSQKQNQTKTKTQKQTKIKHKTNNIKILEENVNKNVSNLE